MQLMKRIQESQRDLIERFSHLFLVWAFWSEFSWPVLLWHTVMVSFVRTSLVTVSDLITGNTGLEVSEIEICFQTFLPLLTNGVPVNKSLTNLFRVYSFVLQTNMAVSDLSLRCVSQPSGRVNISLYYQQF